jgi:hypothetical protein
VLHVCVMEVFYYLLLVWLLIFCDLKRWEKGKNSPLFTTVMEGGVLFPVAFCISTHTHTQQRERERERERVSE